MGFKLGDRVKVDEKVLERLSQYARDICDGRTGVVLGIIDDQVRVKFVVDIIPSSFIFKSDDLILVEQEERRLQDMEIKSGDKVKVDEKALERIPFHEKNMLDGNEGVVMDMNNGQAQVQFICNDMPRSFIFKIDELVLVDREVNYKKLGVVLGDAANQAMSGKGKERHANDNAFEDQVICVVQRLLRDHPYGGLAFQAIKKTIEAGRLYEIQGKGRAYDEILGAINYLAAMNVLIQEELDNE